MFVHAGPVGCLFMLIIILLRLCWLCVHVCDYIYIDNVGAIDVFLLISIKNDESENKYS